jgi:hypothetical protein
MIFIISNYDTVEVTSTHDKHNFSISPKNYL